MIVNHRLNSASLTHQASTLNQCNRNLCIRMVATRSALRLESCRAMRKNSRDTIAHRGSTIQPAKPTCTAACLHTGGHKLNSGSVARSRSHRSTLLGCPQRTIASSANGTFSMRTLTACAAAGLCDHDRAAFAPGVRIINQTCVNSAGSRPAGVQCLTRSTSRGTCTEALFRLLPRGKAPRPAHTRAGGRPLRLRSSAAKGW